MILWCSRLLSLGGWSSQVLEVQLSLHCPKLNVADVKDLRMVLERLKPQGTKVILTA